MSPEAAPGSIFPYLNAPGRGQSPSTGAMAPIFGANAAPISGGGSGIASTQPGTNSTGNPTDFLQKMVLTSKLIDAFGGPGTTASMASKAGGLLGGMMGGKGGAAGMDAAAGGGGAASGGLMAGGGSSGLALAALA